MKNQIFSGAGDTPEIAIQEGFSYPGIWMESL